MLLLAILNGYATNFFVADPQLTSRKAYGVYMNEIVKTQEVIDLCIKEIKEYKPLTQKQYIPIYRKSERYTIIIRLLLILMIIFFVIAFRSLMDLLIPEVPVFNYGKMIFLTSLTFFIISAFSTRKMFSVNDNLLNKNNLISLCSIDSFDEIDSDSYQMISDVSNTIPEFKNKVKEILKNRDGIITGFDFINLNVIKLLSLLKEQESINESNKKRDLILTDLFNDNGDKNND